jgi:hypothetical protein
MPDRDYFIIDRAGKVQTVAKEKKDADNRQGKTDMRQVQRKG